MFDPNEPQANEITDADVVRDQLNALKALIDAVPVPAAETDPVFAASEAAQLVPGDKSKLDTALQPGGNVSALGNDAGYLINPMSNTMVGEMIYNIWSDTAPGATMRARLAIGTPGQVLTATPDWQNGTGVFPAWRDLVSQNVGYTPANPGNWASPPASIAEALDRLAALASNNGANPIP